MKRLIKNLIKSIPWVYVILLYKGGVSTIYSKQYRNCTYSKTKKCFLFLKIIFSHRFIISDNVLKRTRLLLSTVKIVDDKASPFFYSIDTSTMMIAKKSVLGNLTPDYTVLLHNSLSMLITKYGDTNTGIILKAVDAYCSRCIDYLNITKEITSEYTIQKITHLKRMKTDTAETFFEALQRILFINQLVWQERHSLIGLGHLDKILYPYYKHDIDHAIITKQDGLELIKNFLLVLHKEYWYKSSVLLGDTGQIIILGGFDGERYVCNDVTYMFIQALTELQIPDPKLLVRVHRSMPLALLQASVRCMQTGIGSPLFANDEVIVPALINFGYEEVDAYTYGVSACWEPLIIGKSSDANNCGSINFIEPLQTMLHSGKHDFLTYNDFYSAYKQALGTYVNGIIERVYQITWEKAPLLSLFVDNCKEKGLDISDNGAKYNNYGLTTVALSNTVNSLLNIKKYVYELKMLTIQDLCTILINNYKDHEDWQRLFKNEEVSYGLDNEDVLQITHDIMSYISTIIERYPDMSGKRKIKFGLSSPSYISSSNTIAATPDGRKAQEPFAVHISNDKSNDFTSLFSFASQIDYSANRFNGNVIDFIVSPAFIEHNFDQFVSMLYSSFISGIFEMQLNVISSTLLIRAKEKPEEFKQLIVRVWGFSAYFNDLPQEYKDTLIERAIAHEYAYN